MDLGWSYDNGIGVEKNNSEAIGWYQKAAQQGNPQAQLNLGLKYENGVGVPKNYTEASGLYR